MKRFINFILVSLWSFNIRVGYYCNERRRVGLLLGFEYFINERRKVGSWKITLPKLILLGLPSLFFSLTHLIALINNTFIQDKLLIFSRLGTNFIPVFQIILGYTAITCLYKYNGENEDEYSGERES